MLKVFRSKKGFTLVELMVVAIIVAILAAVAVPLMSAQKKRAYATEAESTLGMIRTALRVYYAEYGKYPVGTATAANQLVAGAVGIVASDLSGTFFSSANYKFDVATTDTTFKVRCDWGETANDAPKASVVKLLTGSTAGTTGVIITTLDQDGTFSRTGY